MTKPRVAETDRGIQGEFDVNVYDKFQRSMKDRGWIETGELLSHGITGGYALEVGPGPGYLGLEWLKRTESTSLRGLEISPDMIGVAERNAREYGLAQRVQYVQGDGSTMPFKDETFDAVFTNGSLHEWVDPRRTFDEAWRVLKSGGRLLVSDLRRDMFIPLRWFLWLSATPKEIRAGLITSLDASYTPSELRELIGGTSLVNCVVSSNPLGVILFGVK